MKIYNLFFSPKGTTEKVSTTITQSLGFDVTDFDLIKNPLVEDINISQDDCLVIGVPVYMGRIPSVCPAMLSHLKGNHTPVIAFVTYGNRAFEDALLELTDLLTANGFVVIAAAAFVAEHSLFTQIAANRPNAEDIKVIMDFSLKCSEILKGDLQSKQFEIEIPGNHPYRDVSPAPLHPSANKKCISCGICAKICPTGAIPKEQPNKTTAEVCISCGACIKACPQKSRGYAGITYAMAGKAFSIKCSAPRAPETFYAK